MSKDAELPTKKLIDYLPAIFLDGADDQTPGFLSSYLRAFERVLFGGKELKAQDSLLSADDAIEDGLEEEVAAIPTLFDPWQTPEEFLPWLASWVALSFHPELRPERRRSLLAHIVPLYRIRGTKSYLEQLLTLCLDVFVSVDDTDIPALQVGGHSTLGADTYIGGGPPHFFSVRLIAPRLDRAAEEVQMSIAHEILALAKPAHTFYHMTLASPQLRVGVHSRIGLDTVLGAS